MDDSRFLDCLAADYAALRWAAAAAELTVRPSPREVTVTDGAPDHPRALIEAAPDPSCGGSGAVPPKTPSR